VRQRTAAPGDLNWPALADASATTAIYMPRRTIGRILATAIARGLPATTPALVIFNATRPDEHLVHGIASTWGDAVQAAASKGPVLVIVGEAIRMAGQRAEERVRPRTAPSGRAEAAPRRA
jgi:uroporphyrin-III C-methyltransferase/precorrin-2 dehydrogenase/sirohydrochlorin ferrochelatase